MRLTSTAFDDSGEIPTKYARDGANVSPPLAWSGVPAGTRSFALIVDDPDAPDPAAPTTTWVHWVIADLPADARALPENVSSVRGRTPGHVGPNGWHHAGWDGPSPPIGRHRYFFKLCALDRVLELEHPSKIALERAMAGHVLAATTLIGTYQRAR